MLKLKGDKRIRLEDLLDHFDSNEDEEFDSLSPLEQAQRLANAFTS